jgi:redox-sensitive bicupin YhaK (pirin superfamily)
MIRIRRANERGHTDWGWLDSRHTFSFGDYYDPDHMGWRSLRVINDDRVAPGSGFGTHGHRDMEIFSYVLEGALEHKDSLGHGSVIRPGEIQFMRAGTGVTHSEFNPSKTDPLHFLQIWIVPDRRGLPPAYGQKTIDPVGLVKSLVLLASHDGREQSLPVQQDAAVWAARLPEGEHRELPLGEDRHAWVQVARGAVSLDGETLGEGDGAAVRGESRLALAGAAGGGEVLVFDLA